MCERERECESERVRALFQPASQGAMQHGLRQVQVDVRLPGKGNGARPVHLIVTKIKWIRTRGLSVKNSR